MDPRIEHLKSTTFFCRRFTRQQIAQVQETVATFPALSRKELAQVICEHLRWRTPAGKNRVAAGLGLLEALHKEGILALPPKQEDAGDAKADCADPSHGPAAADLGRPEGPGAAAPATGGGPGADRAVQRIRRPASLPWLSPAARLAPALIPARPALSKGASGAARLEAGDCGDGVQQAHAGDSSGSQVGRAVGGSGSGLRGAAGEVDRARWIRMLKKQGEIEVLTDSSIRVRRRQSWPGAEPSHSERDEAGPDAGLPGPSQRFRTARRGPPWPRTSSARRLHH